MDIQSLYQALILDHNKHPKNFFEMKDASHTAEGKNPVCGDHYHMYAKVSDHLDALSFQGSGCALSKASASLLTEILQQKKKEEAYEIIHAFLSFLMDGASVDVPPKLQVFGGVRDFPGRIKCVTLPWHAMLHALDNAGDVTME